MDDKERRFALNVPQRKAFEHLKRLCEDVSSSEEEKAELIVEATYQLMIQELGDKGSHEQDHPIVAFTILNNVDPGNFIAKPEKVSPTLAPIQYVMRATIFLKMLAMTRESNGTLTMFNALKTERRWVMEGEDSIFAWIRQTVHLAGYWGSQALRMPRFKWEKLGTHFWYNGQRFAYDAFKTMLVSSVDELQASFMAIWEMLGLPQEHIIEPEKLVSLEDEQDKRSTNYSFLDNAANEGFKSRQDKNLAHFVDSGKYCTRVNGELVWFPGKVKQLMAALESFLKDLAMVMYLTGGQPPRGSELMLSLYRNLATRIRNVYIDIGHVINVGFLNKTSFSHKADKPIPRAFPPKVSFVLANYLMYVRPIEHIVALMNNRSTFRDDIDKCYTNLFHINGKALKTTDLTDRLQETTRRMMGAREGFGTRDMRQIMIFIGMRYVSTQERGDEYRSRTDLQAGHVTAVARIHYGVELGRLSPHLTQEVMDAFLQVSRDHHTAFGLATEEEYSETSSQVRIRVFTSIH